MFNFLNKQNKKKLEEEFEDIKRLQLEESNKRELQQQEYKDKIERLFLEIKDTPEMKTILENLFPKIPIAMFVDKGCYILFEYLLSRDYDIGQKNLWSSAADLRDGQNLFEQATRYSAASDLKTANEVISFVNDDLSKMKKLLKSIVIYENEYDYTFVLLRLLQLTAPSYYSQVFMQLYNVDFGDIEKLSLEECLFVYFDKFKNVFDDIFGDPGISLFTYHMLLNDKFGEAENIDDCNFLTRRNELIQLLNDKKESFEYRIFEANMKRKTHKIEVGCTIQDVDLMGGDEFENFVAKIFAKMGYVTKVTKHSRDFGVDVIAEKDGMKVAIQAKCYANPVSNSAIQEIAAGMKYYSCQRGVVVTNRIFTKAAIELARSNTIQLWDRKVLEEKISEIFQDK